MSQATTSPLAQNGVRTALAYFFMLAATIVAFLLIRAHGETLQAPAPLEAAGSGTAAAAQKIDALLHVLLAMVAVIISARGLGAIFAYMHQPPVIGEVLAGIGLGPSLLGRLAPSVSAYILPPSVAPLLGVLAQFGVILYMFLVGLELDLNVLRKQGHATVAISHASIIVPFLLGGSLALYVYPRLSSSDVGFTTFALFMGVSMSVTAFPVLARILTDRGVHKTQMGVVALTCAAADDVSAWCLLAFVVSVAQAEMGGALLTTLLTAGYIALMLAGIRPLLARWLGRHEQQKRPVGQQLLALVFVGLLLSSLATEYIGVHAIFGAFLLGAIIPHDSKVARQLTSRLEDLVAVLLLPAFFAFTGMRTQMGLVAGASQWMICGVIILLASIGKFGGTLAAARFTGYGWRDGAALGILMNTRGLMELIVLNIGLDLRVISPTLFAMLVIMALVTTMATTPILHLLTRNHPWVKLAPERSSRISLPELFN